MDKKYRELLLKDLSARLPFGVKVRYNYSQFTDVVLNLKGIEGESCVVGSEFTHCRNYPIFDGKDKQLLFPYLRSMHNMTDKEEHEFIGCLLEMARDKRPYGLDIDWLNQHHFDYRGLINLGLALEASELIYENTK